MQEIQSVPISSIEPYHKNQKKHPKKQIQQIADSITAFGFNQPIVVDGNGVIVVGHGRYEAAKILGMVDVPVVRLENLSEEEIKAYRLADNKLNESPWDMDLVVDELKDIAGAGIDVSITGFESDILSKDPDEKDDFVPSIEISTSKLGDMYRLGRHTLMCGDSTDSDDVEKLMGGEKADMCFTDPPYNVVDYQGGSASEWLGSKRDGIQNDAMSDQQFNEFLSKLCKNILDNTAGGVYICMASKELPNLKRAFEGADGHWSNFIIWVKNTFTLSRSDYQHQFEPILYGWSNKVKNHYFVGYRDLANVWENLDSIEPKFENGYTIIQLGGALVRVKGRAEGDIMRKRVRFDIWRYQKPSKSEEHPTMKPVALCIEAIVNSSKVGDTVLDLFGGSGTTLIAAEKTNRRCLMMELDQKYVDTIIKRWEEFTGNKAEKIM